MRHIEVGDSRALIERATASVVATIDDAIAARGRCHLLLSGGATPRPLYEALSARTIQWGSVYVFWVDERYVPYDDARSNYRMAREALLDHVDIPLANVHPMPTEFADPHAAATEYERTLRDWFSGTWPRFDLAILGIGADGHVASLFPHSPALDEQKRWVVAVTQPGVESPIRLSLTLPVINASASIHFLVAGAEKADAVAQVLDASADAGRYAAAGVKPSDGDVTWWLDLSAASTLPDSARH